MSKDNEVEVRLRLSKAKTYEHMMWLGLLFFPLVFVFFAMSRGQLREAEAYGLDKNEELTAQNIKSSTRNVMIALVILWVIVLICMIKLYYDAYNTVTPPLKSYSKYNY